MSAAKSALAWVRVSDALRHAFDEGRADRMSRVQDELRALLDTRLSASLPDLLQAELERRAAAIAEHLVRDIEQPGAFERGVEWWAAQHITLVAMLRQLGRQQPLWLHRRSAEQLGLEVTALVAARLSPPFWTAAHTVLADSLAAFMRNGSLSRASALAAYALETVGLFHAFEGTLVQVCLPSIDKYFDEKFAVLDYSGRLLPPLHEWYVHGPGAWVEGALAPISETVTTAACGRLYRYIVRQCLTRLVNQLFEIIRDYPDSKDIILDIKAVMLPEDRALIVQTLENSFKTRLLHMGVHTSTILTQYMLAIRALLDLDDSGIILEKVSDPVRAYLRDRPDCARCVIELLLSLGGDESALGAHAAALSSRAGGSDGLASDDDDDCWQPDAADADLTRSAALRRSHDIIGRLVSIFPLPDALVRSHQTVLAERFLAIPAGEIEQSRLQEFIVELATLSGIFGERALAQCQVMLADMHRSRRLAALLAAEVNTPHGAQGDQVDVAANIISRLYWPQQQAEEIAFPEALQSAIDRYRAAFSRLKPERTLQVLPHAGTVELEIHRDHQVASYVVTPAQAALAGFIAERGTASLEQLSAATRLPTASVRRALKFWLSEGVIEEFAPQHFRPRSASAASAGVAAAGNDDDDDEEGEGEDQQQRSLVTLFVEGMLRNQGPLGIDTIHNRLTMLCDEYSWTKQALQAYLNARIAEDKLTLVQGNLYKLVPQAPPP